MKDILPENQLSADLNYIENINGLPKLQISSNPLVNHSCIINRLISDTIGF
jgi:hypothetical protein